jgi:predicted RNase H-like HicB family nuclease
MNTKEIVFIVEEDPDGGYNASALGHNIFTQADTLPQLKLMIKDALLCHFDDDEERPGIVRTRFVKDEVFSI